MLVPNVSWTGTSKLNFPFVHTNFDCDSLIDYNKKIKEEGTKHINRKILNRPREFCYSECVVIKWYYLIFYNYNQLYCFFFSSSISHFLWSKWHHTKYIIFNKYKIVFFFFFFHSTLEFMTKIKWYEIEKWLRTPLLFWGKQQLKSARKIRIKHMANGWRWTKMLCRRFKWWLLCA